MTKSQINYDRDRLVKELADQFARASGYNVNTNEVSQWSVAADALVKTIEGIVDTKLIQAFEGQPKPQTPFRDDRE